MVGISVFNINLVEGHGTLNVSSCIQKGFFRQLIHDLKLQTLSNWLRVQKLCQRYVIMIRQLNKNPFSL